MGKSRDGMTSELPEFWSEHKSRLRGYIANHVREKNTVDDILQDVFLKAHTNLVESGEDEGWNPQ